MLVGMMGAGKTTVGRALAERLGWAFLDSDAEVKRSTGRTIPEIFESEGEPAFREEEASVLFEAIAREEPTVVAVAGGAVLDPRNRELITGAGLVVWLRAGVGELAERVGDGAGRPLLGDDPAAALARLEAERAPLYREVAEVVVDTGGRRPGEVVAEIEGHVAAASG